MPDSGRLTLMPPPPRCSARRPTGRGSEALTGAGMAPPTSGSQKAWPASWPSSFAAAPLQRLACCGMTEPQSSRLLPPLPPPPACGNSPAGCGASSAMSQGCAAAGSAMGPPGEPLLSLGEPALRVDDVLQQEADRSGPPPEGARPCEGAAPAPLHPQWPPPGPCRPPAAAAIRSVLGAAQPAKPACGCWLCPPCWPNSSCCCWCMRAGAGMSPTQVGCSGHEGGPELLGGTGALAEEGGGGKLAEQNGLRPAAATSQL